MTQHKRYAPMMASDQGPFYRGLGRQLAAARKAARMTQDALARALDLSRTSITNVEKGRQPIQVHLLVDAARILGVTVQQLLPTEPDDADAKMRDLPATYSAAIRTWISELITDHSRRQELRNGC